MTHKAQEMQEAFELHFDKWRKENPCGVYNAINAWEYQQTKINKAIDALEIAKRCVEADTPIRPFSAYHMIIHDTLNEIKEKP